MRWALVILLGVCTASATWMNMNRMGHKLQRGADLDDDDDFDRVSQYDWSDDDIDMEDSSDEDSMYPQRGPRKPYHPHHKHQQHKGHHRVMEGYDEEDMKFDIPPQQRNPKRKQKQESETCYSSQCQKQRKSMTFDEDDFPTDIDEEDEYEHEEKIYRQKEHQKRQHERKQRLLHGEEEGQYPDKQEECKPNYDAMKKLVQINAQLAAKLHKEGKDLNDDKNTVVSPVALQLVLAALKQGAKGETKTQIEQVLGAGTIRKQDQNAHVALAKSLKGQGPDQGGSRSANIKYSANIIFRQQSAQEQFVHSIKDCLDAEVKRCDFKKQPHQCRDQINKWLMGKQDHKLQSVLAHNTITANTQMISIGTMQVKANWGRQFKKNMKTASAKGLFYPLGDDKPVSVKMIQTDGDFNYFEDDQMGVLAIQTQENLLTLYVILPKDRHGLNELEKHRLQYGKQLQELMQRADMIKQMVKVQLPIFQIVHKMETKNMLRKLGTVNPFDLDDADFSGISDEQQDVPVLRHGKRHIGGLEDVNSKRTDIKMDKAPLHVNKLIQQANIQINENGIDVANSQFQHHNRRQKHEEGEIGEQNKQDDRIGKRNEFKVDHAFAFLVKHNPSNQLIMIGRIVDPNEEYEEEKQGRRELDEE